MLVKIIGMIQSCRIIFNEPLELVSLQVLERISIMMQIAYYMLHIICNIHYSIVQPCMGSVRNTRPLNSYSSQSGLIATYIFYQVHFIAFIRS